MKILFIVVFALGMTFSQLQAQEARRSITQVEGDVYRFQNDFHVNVFVITGDGVVVTDPIDADAASWLKTEIVKLTDQPISHLVYSHSHADHASGGLALGQIPNVITQANAPDDLDGIEPTIRFSENLQFTQGDKTFELSYLGPGHGNDMIAMVIRPENVAFIVDVASSRRLFYRDFPNANIDDWIKQLRRLATLDFTTLVGGHGRVGSRADIDDALAYLEELRSSVLEGLQAGKSVTQLADSLMMEKYKHWDNYDNWRVLNIEGMARHLRQTGAAN